MRSSGTAPTSEEVAESSGGDVETAREALSAVRFTDSDDTDE
ncbi:hypothetical protein [Halorubrum laminariae]|uniref:Uncharacterized protein n=1 Tax=Halorubrum laminariae TaxID=1433523 RepID=A0ABD6C2V2_9EURY|nr:hypothetical protein [Halorubrum laminariae]